MFFDSQALSSIMALKESQHDLPGGQACVHNNMTIELQ
jgi:hypothetical protein